MKKLKILLVDDHKMIRDGIRSMLESQENEYKFIIDEAEDGEQGIIKAKTHPDIIIMDYQLPNISGAEAAAKILENDPGTKILALSNYNEYMYIDKMIKTGVKGFILKNIAPEELLKAIEAILNGGSYYSNEVTTKLVTFDSNSSHTVKSIAVKEKIESLLSRREIEVLRYIVNACTNDEIGENLNISRRTAETHRQNILKKLDIKNTATLMKYAMPMFAPVNSND
ncbi:MAG TPA: response regulator transcription factor [Bacteroidia bacterium]|jgi:DNA-binding NarL/FixJ family response regulator|nr:response regulator transcription factor [Bacteroidia bacterium]